MKIIVQWHLPKSESLPLFFSVVCVCVCMFTLVCIRSFTVIRIPTSLNSQPAQSVSQLLKYSHLTTRTS